MIVIDEAGADSAPAEHAPGLPSLPVALPQQLRTSPARAGRAGRCRTARADPERRGSLPTRQEHGRQARAGFLVVQLAKPLHAVPAGRRAMRRNAWPSLLPLHTRADARPGRCCMRLRCDRPDRALLARPRDRSARPAGNRHGTWPRAICAQTERISRRSRPRRNRPATSGADGADGRGRARHLREIGL
jgi:hypothetical protein